MLFDYELPRVCSVCSDEEQLEELKRSNNPCVLWGAGEVAEKVFAFLHANTVKVDAVLIDSGQMSCFHGISCISRNEVERKYESIDLVIAHNRYDYYNIVEKEIRNVKKVYAFSDIFGWDEYFDATFLNEHEEEISEAYSLSEDFESGLAYKEYICSRIHKSPFYVSSDCILDCFFKNSIIKAGDNEFFMDLGACKGNMLGQFNKETAGKYGGIIAVEPESHNYAELEKFAHKNLHDVLIQKIGCWNEKTELNFILDGTGRSNHIGNVGDKSIKIEVDKVDNIVRDMKVTICNLFLQTGIRETLLGMEQILKSQKPKMIIGIGLRKEQSYEIPRLVREINKDYHIYYRFFGALPSRFSLLAV